MTENEKEKQASEEELLAEHDIKALRQAQSEVRIVLDHQIQTFNDVDSNAARTFRLGAILLGLILTAASFVVSADQFALDPYINILTVGSIISLIISFILAVVTYTTTEIDTGLGPRAIERLISEKYSEKEWLILLLRSEAQWMRQNDRAQTINGTLLSISHAFLILAVLGFTLGVALVHSPF